MFPIPLAKPQFNMISLEKTKIHGWNASFEYLLAVNKQLEEAVGKAQGNVVPLVVCELVRKHFRHHSLLVYVVNTQLIFATTAF